MRENKLMIKIFFRGNHPKVDAIILFSGTISSYNIIL
jgi:hypothetical protein